MLLAGVPGLSQFRLNNRYRAYQALGPILAIRRKLTCAGISR